MVNNSLDYGRDKFLESIQHEFDIIYREGYTY